MRFEFGFNVMRLADTGRRSFYASVTVGPWTAWLQRWRARDTLRAAPSTGWRVVLLERDWSAAMAWDCGLRTIRAR